jgi:UDP-GlcNAc3NAcA epimerase
MGHLAREGIAPAACHLVGDVMYDSVLRLAPVAARHSPILAREGLAAGGFVLATIHRAENTGTAEQLLEILAGVSDGAGDLPVVLPLHPRSRALLADAERMPAGGALRLIEPVGFLDMLALEGAARFVITDSGGVQKEAFFQRVPCLTLRHETEWTELVDVGWNRLVPPVSAEAIAEAVRAALTAPAPPAPPEALYGGGTAGDAIAKLLLARAD